MVLGIVLIIIAAALFYASQHVVGATRTVLKIGGFLVALVGIVLLVEALIGSSDSSNAGALLLPLVKPKALRYRAWLRRGA